MEACVQALGARARRATRTAAGWSSCARPSPRGSRSSVSGGRWIPERVIVTSGTSPAMLLVFGAAGRAGDEVIIGTPHYPCYPNFVYACGGTPVLVETARRGGLPARSRHGAPRRITPRTRAIVVGVARQSDGCDPESAETLRALAELGRAAGVGRDLRRSRLRRRGGDVGARGERRGLSCSTASPSAMP